MRKLSLSVVLFAFVLSLSAAKQPNVVLVITDDQGYGDLSCHGNPILKTPHLDKLHSESVRLTDYHVAPTCSPTRAALITGRWTNRTGVWHPIMGRSMLRHNEVTIGRILGDGGYSKAVAWAAERNGFDIKKVTRENWSDLQSIKSFIKRNDLEVPVLIGTPQIVNSYRINAFPSIYVVNETGEIYSSTIGYTSILGLLLRTL